MSNHRPLSRAVNWARGAFTLAIPAGIAATGAALLVCSPTEEKVLLAAGDGGPDPYLADQDQDGLQYHVEMILGTSDAELDSDFDGWDDLIELARNSDPLNAVSTPEAALVDVGMTAKTDGGALTVITAIYTSFSQFPDFGYDMGFSVAGQTAPIPLGMYVGTLQLHPAIDPALGMTGWVILIETLVPESFVAAFGGYLGFYFTVAHKDDPASPVSSSVVNLFNWGDQTVMMQPAPSSMQAGSTYKPLGRGEDIPSTWSQDLVCWQQTSEVGAGTAPGTIELSIEQAACEDLDSYCNATLCANGVGTTTQVLDAGAFAGQE